MTTTSLTGAFDTGRLPRVADAPVTVTVSRRPRPGRELEFEAWIDAAAARLSGFPGSLGVGVLRPGEPNGEWHTVFRFVDGLSLRAWERSPQRAALLAAVEDLVEPETRVQRAVGVEEWFDRPGRATRKSSHVGRLLGDVAWVYPVALTAGLFVAPMLARLSFGLRALATTAIITLVMQTLVHPIRRHVRSRRQFD